jgi:hypothetical protein
MQGQRSRSWQSSSSTLLGEHLAAHLVDVEYPFEVREGRGVNEAAVGQRPVILRAAVACELRHVRQVGFHDMELHRHNCWLLFPWCSQGNLAQRAPTTSTCGCTGSYTAALAVAPSMGLHTTGSFLPEDGLYWVGLHMWDVPDWQSGFFLSWRDEGHEDCLSWEICRHLSSCPFSLVLVPDFGCVYLSYAEAGCMLKTFK